MAEFGFDISKYQKGLDFDALKTKGSFVIIRAGYSTTKDPMFDYFYQQCKARGIKVGAYWYSYANTLGGAKAEANAFLGVIKGKTFEYPIVMDIEANDYTNKASRSVRTSNLVAQLEMLEAAGYFAMWYTYTAYYNSNLDVAKLKNYALWIADYRGKYPGMGTIWQNSSSYYIGSIRIDTNYSYVDYASIIKNAGLNGFPKPDNPDTPETKKYVYTIDTEQMSEGDYKTIAAQLDRLNIEYEVTKYDA